MVHGRPNDGEAEGDVDGRVKRQRFQWDQSLVVVHADVAIRLASSILYAATLTGS